MKFYVDGACRGNGQRGSIGAAAACLMTREGGYYAKTQLVPPVPRGYGCTNQRAELQALIIALEWALKKYEELTTRPYLVVEINSDSNYAVRCMMLWIQKWRRFGWTNANGEPVANRDLIEKAAHLEYQLGLVGEVTYIWVPREQTWLPDAWCNKELDVAAVVLPPFPLAYDRQWDHGYVRPPSFQDK